MKADSDLLNGVLLRESSDREKGMAENGEYTSKGIRRVTFDLECDQRKYQKLEILTSAIFATDKVGC